tara:strand:+ start:8027 stop:8425 length:399 start_codon:yes stop_codon:yes gene_type:complete
MAKEDISFNKRVFNKRDYINIIDPSFNQLESQNIEEQIEKQPSVQEFFDLYNTLFYQINELGPTNSHEFLVKTSGEYINSEPNNELIEALQNEISSLREDLLRTQQEMADQIAALQSVATPDIPEIEIPEQP